MAVVDRPDQQTSTDYEMIDVINPVTQQVIKQIKVTPPEEVADTVERARFAQQAWGKLSVKERVFFMRRWLDLLWEKQSEGLKILRSENGKTDGGAFLEWLVVDTVTQYYIHHAHHILKTENRMSSFPFIQRAELHHKPHGVVGVISPWNYPFLLAFVDSVAALIAGNTVVIKPSEITPSIAQWAVDLMYEAGIPRDVIQVITGDGRAGKALVDYVDFIQFTGSTVAGQKIAHQAIERMIPYSLELGGKDPAIVLNDADPNLTAVRLIQGAFENTGQTCVSIERVYIESGIYDALLERLQHHSRRITTGPEDGFDVVAGSMTNRAELDRTQRHIDDALNKGAKIIAGGNPRPDIGPLFFEPTILVDVDHTMDIMREETFGPVMPIMKVADEKEAIRLANDTDLGLAGSVYSGNLKRAGNVARQINTGDVSINTTAYGIATASVPSGGQKFSGFGRRNGPEGLLKYTASQAIIFDRLWTADESLQLATPFVLTGSKVLRQIRRYIPFV